MTLSKKDEVQIENNINEGLIDNLHYKPYTLFNLEKIPYIKEYCTEEQLHAMRVVGHVLPFKTNNYVVDQLIEWGPEIGKDPIFILTFPQKDMLLPHHYELMEKTLERTSDHYEIQEVANKIRFELNPQPAGQKKFNVPQLENGERLPGAQHKYRETLLFFPKQGQTCHAYCSFCFRWPQFIGLKELRFANKEPDQLVSYVEQHPEIQDVLFTGGDPMVMKYKAFSSYIKPLLEADIRHLQTIRLGTKSLTYWPYKFTTDKEANKFLDLFKEIGDNGIHLSIMAHFNHPKELSTPVLNEAVKNILGVGAQIRTQSPILKNINDKPNDWALMWRKQVDLGMVPYYMFVVRDTGARHYFELPLVKTWEIFHEAYQKVSGICRTVRGPSMSALPGKVQVLGPATINGEKVLVLQFLQGRNPDWVTRPFFAKYDEQARWLDDLKPVFGEKFFFEDELEKLHKFDDLWFTNDLDVPTH